MATRVRVDGCREVEMKAPKNTGGKVVSDVGMLTVEQ